MKYFTAVLKTSYTSSHCYYKKSPIFSIPCKELFKRNNLH